MVGHAAAALPMALGALHEATPEINVAKIPGIKYRNIEDLSNVFKEPIDPKRVEAFKSLMTTGGEIAPLMTTPEAGKFGVQDGKHRLEAFRQLGQRFVPTLNLNTLTQEQNNAYSVIADRQHQAMEALVGDRSRLGRSPTESQNSFNIPNLLGSK